MSEDYSKKALVSNLADLFREVGFNWRAYERIKPRPAVWVRPPLFTDLCLGAQDMQGYLGVQVRLGIDEMLDVYERFISGYLYTKNYWDVEADQWLRRQLNMLPAVARSLFTPSKVGSLRTAHQANLVQLAAVVAYNYQVDYEHGPDSFVVRALRNAAEFGVRDGRVVSNAALKWGHRMPSVKLGKGHNKLVLAVRGEGEVFPATLFEVMRAWLEENTERLGERGRAMGLGLQILRWRMPTAPAKFWRLVSREFGKEALASACRDARHFDEHHDPIIFLREIFTPHFITPSDFADLFGNPHQRVTTPVPQALRQKWGRAINSLDPGKETT